MPITIWFIMIKYLIQYLNKSSPRQQHTPVGHPYKMYPHSGINDKAELIKNLKKSWKI